jgi:hypothetical protein
MSSANQPLGPNGEWKTGQRVPENGDYVDQFGLVTCHEQGRTFPPALDRKSTCAYRLRVEPSQTAATV